MRNTTLLKYKAWYQSRKLREQILVLFLHFAVLYGLFSLTVLEPLDNRSENYQKQLSSSIKEQKNWELQLSALNKLTSTPLYQQWKKQKSDLKTLETQYQSLIKKPLDKKWEEVITTILQSQTNIVLENITSMPERKFNDNVSGLNTRGLYEQEMTISIRSNYFDTLTYLQHLENALPGLHWKRLLYEVHQYPMAKVQLEFSIIYEKS